MNRRESATYVLVSLLLLALSVPVVAQPRTVDFAVYASPEGLPMYEEFFDAFTAKTGIAVNFIQVPSSQIQKWEQVITRVAGGVSPDIVGAVSVEFVQYAAVGLAQPFDPFIATDPDSDVDGLVPTLVDAFQWQGQQYLLPYGASGIPLMYNQRLFDEAGVARPPAAWGDPGWTWDHFVNLLRSLTRRDGEGNIVQFGLAGPPWDGWITLPYNWGGDWIDSELKRFTGNESGAIAALQAMQDLRWTYHVMPQPSEPGGGFNGFLAGKVAVAGAGTWNLPRLLESDETFTMMPWFQVDNNPLKGPINPVGLVMLSSAPHPQEAWEFVKFATMDPVGNYLYARAAGALPSYIGEPHQEWLREITDAAPEFNPMAFLQQVAEYPAIVNIRKVTTFNEINSVMTAAVNDVINNVSSPRQAMDEVAPVVQMLIDMSEH